METKTVHTGPLNLSATYYSQVRSTVPEVVYEFYKEYVEATEGLILEGMCGAGRCLLPLLEEGFSVEGVEASEALLDQLKVKCNQLTIEPKVYAQSLQQLTLPHYYSLIFIPLGSFGQIEKLEDAQEALKRLYAHLKPGGTLVFDIGTARLHPGQPQGVWSGNSITLENGSQILLKSLLLAEERQLGRFVNQYDLIVDNRIVQTEIEQVYLRLYTIQEITELLEEAGFTIISFFKPYDSEKEAGDKDPSIVCEAIREE